jgi:beta-xylosidase
MATLSDSSAPTFKNPILRGFNPDPTICVVRSHDDGSGMDKDGTGNATEKRGRVDYYLSTSTFEYFPGCAIYHSTDLLNWELIGHALTRRSQIEMRTVEPGYSLVFRRSPVVSSCL